MKTGGRRGEVEIRKCQTGKGETENHQQGKTEDVEDEVEERITWERGRGV